MEELPADDLELIYAIRERRLITEYDRAQDLITEYERRLTVLRAARQDLVEQMRRLLAAGED